MGHTDECLRARGGPDVWPRVGDLRLEELEDVLACPDPAHDPVRAARLGALSAKARARAAAADASEP